MHGQKMMQRRPRITHIMGKKCVQDLLEREKEKHVFVMRFGFCISYMCTWTVCFDD